MTMRDVLIVGAGPSGLAAATELRKLGATVTVLDRERELGGIPRHCEHTGFGVFDLRQVLSGPRYAERRVELASEAGAELLNETTVTGWGDGLRLATTSPRARIEHSARAVLLAMGCRERPRAARFVPGTRAGGIFTTGSLQQLVYRKGITPGKRAVIVGAEHVSFSAAHTLASHGVEIAAMITSLPAHQTYAPFRLGAQLLYRFPILTSTHLMRIDGSPRVERIHLRRDGEAEARAIDCDTVVFTGEWIPDHELAYAGGIAIDEHTRGPRVDAALRTSRVGVFASGNVLRGAETADVSALEGIHAARAIARYLDGGGWIDESSSLPIETGDPLTWISPNVISDSSAPPRRCFTFRVARFVEDARIEIRQGARHLADARFSRLVPNRWYTIDASFVADVRAGDGPVSISSTY